MSPATCLLRKKLTISKAHFKNFKRQPKHSQSASFTVLPFLSYAAYVCVSLLQTADVLICALEPVNLKTSSCLDNVTVNQSPCKINPFTGKNKRVFFHKTVTQSQNMVTQNIPSQAQHIQTLSNDAWTDLIYLLTC